MATITNIHSIIHTLRRILSPSPWERAGERLLGVRLLFLFVLSCGSAFAQNYQGFVYVNGREFLERNDTLFVSFDIHVDSKAVPTCGTVIFEPELADDTRKVILPYIRLTGKKRAHLDRRWFALCSDEWLSYYQPPHISVTTGKYTDEILSYNIHLPYEDWMEQANLSLKQEITGCRHQSQLYVYTLNNCLNLSPRAPYQVQPLVSMSTPDDASKTRVRQGSAFLDFQVGRSVILPDFRRNPVELAKINDAISGIADDADVQLKGITVEGFASPEGTYASNEKLSRERAAALKEYIRNRYFFAEQLFTVRWTGEDWKGLKTLVEQSDLDYKNELLAVISGYEEPDAKERKLKAVGRGIPYSKMLRELFPELRRVEYRVDYMVRNYNLSEAKEVLRRNPDNLSQLEMYRVAESYGKDSREYREIMTEIIPKHFATDAVAINNAAALLIGNEEYQTARRLLEKVSPQSPSVWNNLGVIALQLGELDKAEELLNQAALVGLKEAVHNLEEMKRKREDDKKR
ncbi:DUF3868 domain-containing protein [Bacteroides sp. 224]|uniref:DUF3868 domain-containing protein n=1 Tax=Bacteroides sp. 224 TaxID=2302936 RepID=UPI0013D73B59|nr:tetratricopeptide repeat protein [Bacteroides sp. 224]NDV66423.1 DUF3868 domain-containing protein [Bacteroides sp. 224]